MLTAFLSRADVSRHVQALHLLRELREAFTAGRLQPSSPSTLEFVPGKDGAATLVRQAAIPGFPAWMVNVRTSTPTGVRSVLQLHEAESGKLLAVMDAAQVTALRASLMSALAADVLARPDAKNVAVLGVGTAASTALKSLRLVRSIEHVWFHEPNVAENFEFSHRLGRTLSMAITAADTVHEAVANADLVVLTGQVALGNVALRPGTHVTVLGAEQFKYSPVMPTLLERSRSFTDATPSALSWGKPFDATLTDVLAKTSAGRERDDQLTVFASESPAVLDLLAAWHVYEGARTDETLTRIDLEA